jgi:hypothetical protein
MNTAKDEVRKLLDRLPEGASFEDIQYQVYVLDEITRAGRDGRRLQAGRLLSRYQRKYPNTSITTCVVAPPPSRGPRSGRGLVGEWRF